MVPEFQIIILYAFITLFSYLFDFSFKGIFVPLLKSHTFFKWNMFGQPSESIIGPLQF